jgi:hypothetical protein
MVTTKALCLFDDFLKLRHFRGAVLKSRRTLQALHTRTSNFDEIITNITKPTPITV